MRAAGNKPGGHAQPHRSELGPFGGPGTVADCPIRGRIRAKVQFPDEFAPDLRYAAMRRSSEQPLKEHFQGAAIYVLRQSKNIDGQQNRPRQGG